MPSRPSTPNPRRKLRRPARNSTDPSKASAKTPNTTSSTAATPVTVKPPKPRTLANGTGSQTVEPIPLTGLQPAATYHYRIVATNAHRHDLRPGPHLHDAHQALDRRPLLLQPHLHHGRCSTPGSIPRAPTPDTASNMAPPPPTAAPRRRTGEITDELTTDHSVEVELTGLQPDVTYHFRVVAENPYGTTDSEDQTFGFHPPNCPNAHLRQITNSSSLPDCRAYELVSPANAGGTSLFPQGPNSPEATNPARFAFGGVLGDDSRSRRTTRYAHGDLYVATRTDQGWVTKYVGPPGNADLWGQRSTR